MIPKHNNKLLILFIFSIICLLTESTVIAKSQVCFSPQGKCNELVASYIEQAKESIIIAVYFFTDSVVRNSLSKAYRSGKVKIHVLVDDDCTKTKWCKSYGGPFIDDGNPTIKMHHKFIVIDNSTVITGSMNFTEAAALKNFENILVLHDKRIANQYSDEFWRIWKKFTKKGEHKTLIE